MQHVPHAVIYRVEVRTVGWPCQDWWTEVSHGAEARLCHERDVMAHCLAGRQTRLQQRCGLLVAASASATHLGNTARWVLLQAQWRWGWYSRVWILQDRVSNTVIRMSCRSVLLWHELNFGTAWWNATLPSVRRKSLEFYKWHFSGVVGKGATGCFLLK